MTITWSLSTVVGDNGIDDDEKMQGKCWWFRSSCGCGSMMRGALPDEAHPGLYLKPLDAAIGRVPAPYYPSGRHGQQICWKHTKPNKKLFLASDYGTHRSLVVHENVIPQKRPSTQLINATSCVKMCDATIGAEELADISSYQTLSADKN